MAIRLETNILLVDDVDANLTALESLLGRPELKLLKARSGTEALELLLRHEVALALVDVRMPEMSGFELAEFMRGMPRTQHVPIIFLTAEQGEAARVFKGYEAGAVDFLVKPLDGSLLRSKVDVFVQLHQQRRQLAEQLESLQQMLRLSDVFIGVLGHDLRTPLGAIQTTAELLQRSLPQDAAVQRGAARIRRSTDRMGKLIQQLLDFARARLGGGIPVQPADADLAELARAAVAEFDPELGARLHVAANGSTRGTWDPDRMLQVVSNLLMNALQHGRPDSTVELRLDGSSPAQVELEVWNSGRLQEELRPHLFEPATSRSRSEGGGLGLGLYIVHQIVEAHGGDISVDTQTADRVCFRITLPRRTEVSTPAPRALPLTPPPPSA